MPIPNPGVIVKDTYNTIINGVAIPVHLYYLNADLMKEPNNFPQLAIAPFTQAGQTMQMIYVPFLDVDQIQLSRMQFDNNYYGPLNTGGAQRDEAYVYKITGLVEHNTWLSYVKNIPCACQIYTPKTQLTGTGNGKKHFNNESKLQQAPYRYMQIQDFNTNPLMLAPHLFGATDLQRNKFDVKVRTGINLNGGYIIFVPWYKGDANGNSEGAVAEKGLDLPVSSSVFNDYMARNKSQIIANTKISAIHGGIDAVEGGFNAMLGVATAGAGAYRQEISSYDKIMSGALDNPRRGREAGWTWMNRRDIAMGDFINNPHINYGTHNASSGLANFAHGLTNMYASAYHLNAQMSDMFGAPRNVSMSSSDALFSFNRSEKRLMLQYYTITDYYKEKLCDFWTMYGYKQRKMKKISKDTFLRRRYFTYIKTVDIELEGDKIDKSEMLSIKEIFNNGIRFWRFFRLKQDNMKMYDYSRDNVEE